MPRKNALASPRILLVHGAWHGAWCWERQFAPWLREQGHEVESLDLPGHGRPDTKRIPWFSIRDYADAVEAVIERSPRPVIVAGHSMGGLVTQKLMERRPSRLAGAALFASVPVGGTCGTILHLARQRPLDLIRTTLTVDLYWLMRNPQRLRGLCYGPELAEDALREYWQPVQNESFRAFLDMLLLDLPRPAKADPALPKWIVGAELDGIFAPSKIRATAAAYDEPATIYPNIGHNLMLDVGWEKVAADFSAWVKSVGAGASARSQSRVRAA